MNEEIRKYQRLAKGCRVEYCLFQSIVNKEGLKESSLNDIGGGGASFFPGEKFDKGTQLYLKIYVPGWSHENGELEKVVDDNSEVMLETIAEVIHSEPDLENSNFMIGTKFLGKVNL